MIKFESHTQNKCIYEIRMFSLLLSILSLHVSFTLTAQMCLFFKYLWDGFWSWGKMIFYHHALPFNTFVKAPMKIGHEHVSTCKNSWRCWLQRHGIQCKSFSFQHMYWKIALYDYGDVVFFSVEFDIFYTKAQVALLKCQSQIISIFKQAAVSWMPLYSMLEYRRTIGYGAKSWVNVLCA